VIDPLRLTRFYDWITRLIDGSCILIDLLDATERALEEQGYLPALEQAARMD
jgi:hypothetical protein